MRTTLLRSALLLFALARSASAQCASWSGDFAANTLDDLVNALVVYDDGSGPALYAGGWFTTAGGTTVNRVAKWDGTQWSPLGGGVGHRVNALAVYDDGLGPALYAGGWFTTAGGVAANYIAKWDGASWSALGTGLDGPVYSLAVHDDGTNGPCLYVGGGFGSAGGVLVHNIARWNGVGWSSPGFGLSGGGGDVLALATYDAGSGPRLYAGGRFTQADFQAASKIAVFDGIGWSPVGGGMNTNADGVHSFAVHDDGTGPALFVGGTFNTAGGVVVRNVAKWDGASWSGLAGGTGFVTNVVKALAVFDDGSGPALFATGSFLEIGGASIRYVAKWDGAMWSALGSGFDTRGNALAVHDDGTGPALFAGGDFLTAGGVGVSYVAAWQGTSWTGVGSTNGTNGGVSDLAVLDDGSGPALYAAGSFTSAGAMSASRIARWNAAGWSTLGSGLGDDVLDLAVYDDGSGTALYACGLFGPSCISKWDGAIWSALGSGLTSGGPTLYGSALGVYDDGAGPALYVGGNFDHAGGVPANNVARWDGTNWSALGSGLSGAHLHVGAFAEFDDGSGPALFVGGEFATAGGLTVNNIAKWNGTTWSGLAGGSSTFQSVSALAVYDDGSGPALYAGGYFTSIGGTPANYIAKWNGASWSALGSGLNGGVGCLLVFDDGTGRALYVAGGFTSAGGATANNIARWNGASWSTIGSGLNGGAGSLAIFDDGVDADRDLYVGGGFSAAGGLSSSHIAKWHGCGAGTYCFGDGTLATACPCGNSGALGRGCENSEATGGAALAVSGSQGPDTAVLTATGERSSAFTVFLQGTANLPNGVRWGDGVRCVGGSLKRLYKKNASGGVVVAPDFGAGESSITARSAALGDVIPPGSTRYYQTYYRDPSPTFCPDPPGNTWNSSSGVKIRW